MQILKVAILAASVFALSNTARAQQPEQTPRGISVLLRLEGGALNPGQLDATTMSVGASAGLAFRGRTALIARFLRQSQNGNSGADLSRNARDIVSLVLEHAWGRAERRRLQYLVRAGAGVMFRSPWEAAPLLTVGVGARYPVYRSVTLVGSFEIDMADLIGGAYDTFQWNPDLLRYVAVRTAAKLQPNFGFLLAVEWHPLP